MNEKQKVAKCHVTVLWCRLGECEDLEEKVIVGGTGRKRTLAGREGFMLAVWGCGQGGLFRWEVEGRQAPPEKSQASNRRSGLLRRGSRRRFN